MLFVIIGITICVLLTSGVRKKRILLVLAAMLCLTLVFDNLLVGVDIVRYDSNSILGFKLGAAPIEDFAYALVAAVVMPVIWSKLKKRI